MVSGNILQTEAWVTNNSRALVSVSGLSLKKSTKLFSLSQSICYSVEESTFIVQINGIQSLKLYLLQLRQNKD